MPSCDAARRCRRPGWSSFTLFTERLDPAVDLVISGHTHQPYSCVVNGIPVTSAYSFGRLLTDIDMRVSRATKDVTSLTIDNRIVTRDVTADSRITDLITRYDTLAPAAVVDGPRRWSGLGGYAGRGMLREADRSLSAETLAGTRTVVSPTPRRVIPRPRRWTRLARRPGA